jgi:uncharacterized damage-inducible protein DinB
LIRRIPWRAPNAVRTSQLARATRSERSVLWEAREMKSVAAAGTKSPALDLKRSLLETYAINEKANQLLLTNVSEEAWNAAPPAGKGRTIAGVASHIHNVRLLWLAAADKSAKVPAKLDAEKATRAEVMESLAKSAAAMHKLIQKGLEDPAGKVPNFKPDVVAFLGYLIAHDSHHRGQIGMLARQVGHPIPAKTGFGLWEWGTLWKDCGFTR